ncbi:hypothetical protein BH23CHL2_BH23CHL2_33330 [soil metagenome]
MDADINEYYKQIATAVDRICAAAEGLDGDGLNWRPIPVETSSLCILNVHIVGNIRQGILSTLCGHPDNRDRDSEFTATCDSFQALQDSWNQLKAELEQGMAGLTKDDLEKDYVHPRRGPMNGWTVLLNTATHANEHVGHAELTRQLWDVK